MPTPNECRKMKWNIHVSPLIKQLFQCHSSVEHYRWTYHLPLLLLLLVPLAKWKYLTFCALNPAERTKKRKENVLEGRIDAYRSIDSQCHGKDAFEPPILGPNLNPILFQPWCLTRGSHPLWYRPSLWPIVVKCHRSKVWTIMSSISYLLGSIWSLCSWLEPPGNPLDTGRSLDLWLGGARSQGRNGSLEHLFPRTFQSHRTWSRLDCPMFHYRANVGHFLLDACRNYWKKEKTMGWLKNHHCLGLSICT